MNPSSSISFQTGSFLNHKLTLSEPEEKNCHDIIVDAVRPRIRRFARNSHLEEQKKIKRTFFVIFFETESWREVEKMFNRVISLSPSEEVEWAQQWTTRINQMRMLFEHLQENRKIKKEWMKNQHRLMQEVLILGTARDTMGERIADWKAGLLEITRDEEDQYMKLNPLLIQDQVQKIKNKIKEYDQKLSNLADKEKDIIKKNMDILMSVREDVKSTLVTKFMERDDNCRIAIEFLTKHWNPLTAFRHGMTTSLDAKGISAEVIPCLKEPQEHDYTRLKDHFKTYQAIFTIQETGKKENHDFIYKKMGATLLLLEGFQITKIISKGPEKNVSPALELWFNQRIVNQKKEEPKSSNYPTLDKIIREAFKTISNKTLKKENKRIIIGDEAMEMAVDWSRFFDLLIDRYTKDTVEQPSLTVKSPSPEESSGNPHSLDLSRLSDDQKNCYETIVNFLSQQLFRTVDHAIPIDLCRSYVIFFHQSQSLDKIKKTLNKIIIKGNPLQKLWAEYWESQISNLRKLNNALKDQRTLKEDKIQDFYRIQECISLIEKRVTRISRDREEKMLLDSEESEISLLNNKKTQYETILKMVKSQVEQITNVEKKFFGMMKVLLEESQKTLNANWNDHELMNNKTCKKVLDFLQNNWKLLIAFLDWPDGSLEDHGLSIFMRPLSKDYINATLHGGTYRTPSDYFAFLLKTRPSLRAIFIVKEDKWMKNPLTHDKILIITEKFAIDQAQTLFSSLPLPSAPLKENSSSKSKSLSTFIHQAHACDTSILKELKNSQADDAPIREEKLGEFDLLNKITEKAIETINQRMETP